MKIKRYHDSSHPLSHAKTLAQQTVKQISQKLTIAEDPDQDERLNRTLNPADQEDILLTYIKKVKCPNETWINVKTSSAIEFHLKHDAKKEDVPLKQQIPEVFHKFLDVFDETKADHFPEPCPWDHKIELKEGFQPKSFKMYNLTPEEQKRTGQMDKKKPGEGIHLTIAIPYGLPILLCQKKGWTTKALPGLSIPQQLDDQECLPATAYL